jgi:NAD(P)-dependent dehydrogenase (short-subunit alcohol dehydrogenase family)
MAQSDKRRLANKVALITGSGRGIGRCEALLMAQQGAKVVVSDIGTDPDGASTAEKVASEIRTAGGEAVSCTDNVATLEGARRTVDAALHAYGRLDILVNNAGLRAGNPVDKLTEDQWNLVVDSHLKASFAMTKFAVPVFKRQGGGVIVNTGSEAGLGMIFNSAYAAAKEGIAGLTRSVAREQGRFGIRCNMIRPRATVNTGGGAWGKEIFTKWLPMARALESVQEVLE